MREALEKAISAVDGLSELARRLEVTPQTVVNWRKRGIPPRRVLDVERATVGANGQPAVTRHELRPDIYPTEPVR